MGVEDITISSFYGFIAQPRAVIIGAAESCEPSMNYLKIARAVSERVPEVAMGFLNTDDEASYLAGKRNIPKMFMIPFTAFFSEGRCIAKIDQALSDEELYREIARRYTLSQQPELSR